MRLEGRALITGGGRGIGQQIATRLAESGMHVYVAARSEDEVSRVATLTGGEALTGDVSVESDVNAWFERMGPIDLLVNNAGIGDVDPEPGMMGPDWWRTFEVNVRGSILCAQAALPAMRDARRGRIINVVSAAAFSPSSNAASLAYGASKAAVTRWTEQLARRLSGTGVTVFALSPGLVQTDLTASLGYVGNGEYVPMEKAARLAAHIASGQLDSLTGRVLRAAVDDADLLRQDAERIVSKDLKVVRLNDPGAA